MAMVLLDNDNKNIQKQLELSLYMLCFTVRWVSTLSDKGGDY